MRTDKNRVIIACSVFRYELEELLKSKVLDEEIIYMDSMLHMYPEKLKKQLDATIEKNGNKKIILLFGDCHAKMIDYQKNDNIKRSIGINCCEIMLGSEKYKKLRKENSFILLHEWVARWKEVFQDYMGFKNKKTASEFMQDMHKKLVLIDSGVKKTDFSLLDQVSDYTGLPVEIISCNSNNLLSNINNCINSLKD